MDTLESLILQELKLKNPHKIFWGEDDLFLIIHEKLFNEGIQILLINGATFMLMDNKVLNFHTRKIFCG